MRLNRFLVDLPLIYSGVILNKDQIHQIKDVLRLKEGDEIALFNRDQKEVLVRIEEISKKKVEFEIISEREKNQVVSRKVILAPALIKRDKFEWIVQKATETGVSEIVPLITDHAVKFGLQKKRLEKIMIEAVEQSSRISVPALSEPMEFKELLKRKVKKIFFDFNGDKFQTADLAGDSEVIIFIGPEGGWGEGERKAAQENGCLIRSLGAQTFRAETAAIIAGYLASNY